MKIIENKCTGATLMEHYKNVKDKIFKKHLTFKKQHTLYLCS